ncbi:hypothetical protein A1O1_06735 [Capronia coronata CBS 617.96]|uniref:Uncharacterized protein n=1 Tax=Capronia coronata CBS 617.96 TaxID=1182541 RepID=W9Y1I9_9EURO|nr:uncharacterized protein A1O1_06735 [Capronia coronata CBS 617.96]EXJ83116.1 hypothetical protein A1O1_06735 [Capronia coronata CBS 617.96]
MAARIIPALTLTAPTSYPTAGVGGYYYDTAFGVPTYSSAAFNQTTWRLLDNWDHINVNYASSEGLAAGLGWATLIYLLALTPSHKRTTPFHCFLLVGLIFLLGHLMVNIIAALTPGLNTTSAYTYVTLDTSSSVWPRKYIAVYAVNAVASWFAFIFATICLWLQAKGLMTGIRVRFIIVYKIILMYLIVAAVIALAICMAFNIQQILYIGKPVELADGTALLRLRNAYLITYAISIGSFSLVSICSIMDIIWRRPSRVIKGHNIFASALNLVGLLCAQSFVVPCEYKRALGQVPDCTTFADHIFHTVIFCILQVIPNSSGVMLPEIMLLPSVYVILPLGSLFMTVNSPESDVNKTSFPPKSSPGPFDRSPTLTSGTLPGSRPESYVLDMASDKNSGNRKSVCSQFDRELNLIDSLDTLSGREGDSMLHAQSNNNNQTREQDKQPRADTTHVGSENMV